MVPRSIVTTIQKISCAVEPLVKGQHQQEIQVHFNAISVFVQVLPAVMSVEQ